jgi:hypothetical protein
VTHFRREFGSLEAILARVTIFSSWAGSSMAEQLTLNQRVAGSSPARLTTPLYTHTQARGYIRNVGGTELAS